MITNTYIKGNNRPQHYARPLVHTLAFGKQIVFTASTENIVLQTVYLQGEVFGGIGACPFEGGYVYINLIRPL